jgi:3-isopropylmalate/(R)-2-methylmalate dehydratase small subunit
MYNCGMMAIELPPDNINHIFDVYSQHDTILFLDLKRSQIKLSAEVGEELFEFSVQEFDYALVEAGGWVDYADEHY